jgi:hypothetical protein
LTELRYHFTHVFFVTKQQDKTKRNETKRNETKRTAA